jgi:hypothetical protein
MLADLENDPHIVLIVLARVVRANEIAGPDGAAEFFHLSASHQLAPQVPHHSARWVRVVNLVLGDREHALLMYEVNELVTQRAPAININHQAAGAPGDGEG